MSTVGRGAWSATGAVWLSLRWTRSKSTEIDRTAAEIASPVFASNRGFSDFDQVYYPAARAALEDPEAIYESPKSIGFVNLPVVAWLLAALNSNVVISFETNSQITGRISPRLIDLYAALAAGAFSPEMYRCIVAIAPVSDVRKMLMRERSQHGRNDCPMCGSELHSQTRAAADSNDRDVIG